MVCLLLLCLGFGDVDRFKDGVVVEHVDRIEHNVVVNPQTGEESSPQVIFWTYDNDSGQYLCRGWVWADRVCISGREVLRQRGLRWYIVRGGYIEYTRTWPDPELENRKVLPEKYRDRLKLFQPHHD